MIAVNCPEAASKRRPAASYPLSGLQSPSTLGPGSKPALLIVCDHACRRDLDAGQPDGPAMWAIRLCPEIDQVPGSEPHSMLFIDDNSRHVWR